ncbi:MAG: flagellin lysine-N-methylase [Rickettsiales bacterium]
MVSVISDNLVGNFICTTDKCEDTCCKHWSMQMNTQMFAKYKEEAPELVDCVESDNDNSFIMRKDKATSYCVKFDNGKCSIHSEYGEKFLGDACYFYPRITRKAGDNVIMTATMSCPEIARIALFSDKPFSKNESSASRLPQEIRNILPDETSFSDFISVHNIFLEVMEEAASKSDKIFARINSVCRSLEKIDRKDWAGAASLYFRLADSSIPKSEENINDPFNLLHALCGLVVASKKSLPPRLKQTIYEMEKALSVKLDWENILINADESSLAAYNKLRDLWNSGVGDFYEPILKRWLAAQISAASFPFAGLGDKLSDKVTIIGFRLAMLKLALISAHHINIGDKNNKLSEGDIIRIVQSLSRFLDHLAGPEFLLKICSETGWGRESRMLGLLSWQ